MKVLMIALFTVRSCGPTEVIRKIVPELISLGNKVDILSPYAYDKEKDDLAHDLGMNYFYSEHIITSIKVLKQCVPNIENYDILHFHGVYEYRNWIIAKIVKKMNIPYVYTIHGNLMTHALEKSKIKKNIAIKFFIKKILDNATCIHALSQNEARDIHKITTNNVLCIPNGIDKINVLRKKNRIDKICFLYIGRIDVNHKGLDILFEAIKRMPSALKEKCEFVLAGPFESSIDKEYLENNMISNGKYVGPVYGEEKLKQLVQCDYFIHTSRYEGMPMAVLEALSYGIPCIVTAETNMGDIIRESSGGFVSQCSIDSVSDTISKAIAQNGLIEVNIEWLRKHLLWSKIATNYKKLYQVQEKYNNG